MIEGHQGNPFKIGDRVRRAATGDEGVVVSVEGDFCDVTFPSATVSVHYEDLTAVALRPDELLASGRIGNAGPYVLRLQALYLKHAYKYDPLTGLSNARIEPTLLSRAGFEHWSSGRKAMQDAWMSGTGHVQSEGRPASSRRLPDVSAAPCTW